MNTQSVRKEWEADYKREEFRLEGLQKKSEDPMERYMLGVHLTFLDHWKLIHLG